jgi:SAM-dependent methyltransferase
VSTTITGSDRDRLRETFGLDPEAYDRARPGYPSELFDHLAKLACIGPGCRVLEIGPGTGKASVTLAERGAAISAVELSAGLADVARRKLAAFPDVAVEVAAFEEWPLPPVPFDTVIAATAFHWIDPEVRVMKAADALRPGGALATIATNHVAGGTERFFVEVQECYERWDPNTPANLRLPRAADLSYPSEELDSSGRFGPCTFRRYEREIEYASAEYRALLSTFSGHIALDADARASLLDCVTELIDRRYAGRISKRDLIELRVAARL